MSTTFNNFIKQYHRSGSEKADGYDKSSFIGLADHEKKSVFEMLVSELPWIGAIEGLFLLDPVRALEICKKEEEKLRIAGSAAYMLQPFLVKYSGDLIYQRHLIEDYSGYYDDLKPKVVDAVSRTPITTDSIEFFKSVVLTEVNTSAVARASRHLLDALRLPHDEDEDKARYQQLLVDLRSENIQTKLRCLEKIRACSHLICECERSPSVDCLGAATRRGGATARSCNNGRRRLAASPGGLPPEGALAALHVRAGGTTTSPDARLATTPSGGNASRRLNVNRP